MCWMHFFKCKTFVEQIFDEVRIMHCLYQPFIHFHNWSQKRNHLPFFFSPGGTEDLQNNEANPWYCSSPHRLKKKPFCFLLLHLDVEVSLCIMKSVELILVFMFTCRGRISTISAYIKFSMVQIKHKVRKSSLIAVFSSFSFNRVCYITAHFFIKDFLCYP